MMRGPGPGGHMAGRATEKPKNFKKTARKFYGAVKHHRFKIALVAVLAMLSCISSIFAPMIMGQAINIVSGGFAGLSGGTGHVDFDALTKTLGLLIVLYLLGAALGYSQSFIVSGVSTRISYEFRKMISEKIDRLPLKYFDKVSHGDVLSRVTNDIDTIGQSLNQSLSQIITSVTMVVGVFIMMLTISPVMTLIAVAVLPVAPVLIAQIIKRSQVFFKNQQRYLGLVNGHVEESYSGHMIVKVFGAEKDIAVRYDEYNNELYKNAWKSNFFSSLMMPVMGLISNIEYVAVCIIGGTMALRGQLSIGSISSFIQYMRNFTQPISQIAQISNVLQSTAAAAERVFEFLDEPEEAGESDKKSYANREILGAVTFEHVSFGYNDGDTVIKDFNATVKPGQSIAIVGPTGAGKTTVVKLLMRFYELNFGSIYIDGINIADIKRGELRNIFGMVLQDTWLFSGTIRDNIKFGNENATEEEVIKAAKAANVHRFIETLPGGYDYVIDEESGNISQGQKQLLTIARAFLSEPKILILDEATSSVDTRTELLIQQAMSGLMHGKTSFVIAHRLSTIKDADLILVMNNGDIIEQGNHKELLERKGFYAELYNSQFGKSE
ncbi:MAG: ABC transporter ATP-binding protein/permease [Clostridiales bacterium]|nr:ABC transporter ATP-binding protein/permease [Clostridiales bacterium]